MESTGYFKVEYVGQIPNPKANGCIAIMTQDEGVRLAGEQYTYEGNGVWTLFTGAIGLGSGDVVGPASSTDSVPVMFDGMTGKLVKNSTPTGSGNPVLAISPAIVTPTIASFANAQHDHADAAGGGVLTIALPIIATASLQAPGPGMNGVIVIEDAGGGAGNVVVYFNDLLLRINIGGT